MSNEKTLGDAKDLKDGKYMLADGVPCKIVNIDKSKSGKHGGAKLRITAIGIFDGQKKVILTPGDATIEIPIIDRKSVQIMSVEGKTIKVMDSQTYEMYDLDVPEELMDQVAPGKEADVLESMGRRKIERIR
ncbi:MAG: translation initiation factor IF-5A [Candidatus Micrarchaeota archaeon]